MVHIEKLKKYVTRDISAHQTVTQNQDGSLEIEDVDVEEGGQPTSQHRNFIHTENNEELLDLEGQHLSQQGNFIQTENDEESLDLEEGQYISQHETLIHTENDAPRTKDSIQLAEENITIDSAKNSKQTRAASPDIVDFAPIAAPRYNLRSMSKMT